MPEKGRSILIGQPLARRPDPDKTASKVGTLTELAVRGVDPSAVAVLTSLVTGVLGGAAGEAGKQMWGRMKELVRGWFGRDDPTTRAMEQVDLVSADPQMVEAVSGVLAQRLSDSARRDPAFAADLRQWMSEASRAINVDGDVTNTISGEAKIGGSVVQARDIGSVNFGTPQPEAD